MSISGAKLAGGNPARGRVQEDFYATDPETVWLFIQRFHEDGESLNSWGGCKIIEPCCGNGNIVKALKSFDEYSGEGKIIASDIADRNCEGGRIRDFFTYTRDEFARDKIACIITNPPFGEMNSFLSHALYLLPLYGRLVIFSKIQTLEGQGRRSYLERGLRYVYVHSTRQNAWRNGSPVDERGKKWATTMCMAWFVWVVGYDGEPVIRWI